MCLMPRETAFAADTRGACLCDHCNARCNSIILTAFKVSNEQSTRRDLVSPGPYLPSKQTRLCEHNPGNRKDSFDHDSGEGRRGEGVGGVRVGDGYLPSVLTWRTSSMGALISLAYTYNSSSSSVCSCLMAPITALQCRTASTTFPVPASPCRQEKAGSPCSLNAPAHARNQA